MNNNWKNEIADTDEAKDIAWMTKQETILEEEFGLKRNGNIQADIEKARADKEAELKLYMIQKSTRTTFPQFIKLHNKLRMKYRWYYEWHLFPYINHIHWSALTLTTIFFALAIFLSIFSTPKIVQAATTTPVLGTASVVNTGGSLDFTGSNANVIFSKTTGDFSGYAWSSNIGWVAFGTQDNTDGPVHVDVTTGAITGKAAILDDDSTLDFNTAPYGSNAQIDKISGNFSGFAWSGALGWVDFSGVSTDASAFVSVSIPGSSSHTSTPAPDATPSSVTDSTIDTTPEPSIDETSVSDNSQSDASDIKTNIPKIPNPAKVDQPAKFSVFGWLKAHWLAVSLVIVLLLVVFGVLFWLRIRRKRKY